MLTTTPVPDAPRSGPDDVDVVFDDDPDAGVNDFGDGDVDADDRLEAAAPGSATRSGVCAFVDDDVDSVVPADDDELEDAAAGTPGPADEDPDADESEPGVSALAKPYPLATAAPTPSATANPPTRPT